MQELFQLLMRFLFNTSYGMFILDEDTRLYWFRASGMDLRMEVPPTLHSTPQSP